MIRTLLALTLAMATGAPEPMVRDPACPTPAYGHEYAVIVRGQDGTLIPCYDGHDADRAVRP